MVDFFVCTKRRTTNELLAANEIMGNSRNHVSFHKIKESKLFENLNDAYIISMPMFATWK